MHEYFKKTVSPGKLSEAYKAGMESQHSTHSGNWDRNALVAAMLEIKLSMTGHPLDQSTYDTLGLWDRICGGAANIAITPLDHTGAGPAGYRVPTSKQWDPEFETYEDGDVAITEFSPIVAYGSLEMLRSMRLSQLNSCPSGLGHEDALTNQYCENGQEYLVNEMLSRAAYSPFSLQRDVWCNPHSHLTIEQTVGNPEYFDEPLYDTGVKVSKRRQLSLVSCTHAQPWTSLSSSMPCLLLRTDSRSTTWWSRRWSAARRTSRTRRG